MLPYTYTTSQRIGTRARSPHVDTFAHVYTRHSRQITNPRARRSLYYTGFLENITIPKATYSMDDSVESRILSRKQACRLNFDDAVSVLGNLTLAAFSSSSSMSMTEVESLVQRNVQQALFSVGSRPDHKMDARSEIRRGRDQNHKKICRGKRGRGEGGQSEKSIPPPNLGKQVCFDCGDEDHYAEGLRRKLLSKYTMTKRRLSPTERTSFQGQ